MANVPNGVETLLKISIAWVGCTNVRDDRQTTNVNSCTLLRRQDIANAVLKVLSDILLALDTGNLAMLTQLDLSAAFDSVDHHTLLQRLQTSYGLGGQVMNWFASYLHGRVQHVRFSATSSTPSAVEYGVPQGSVLGSILFLLYTADSLQLIKCHQLTPHAYTDDTQIYQLINHQSINHFTAFWESAASPSRYQRRRDAGKV